MAHPQASKTVRRATRSRSLILSNSQILRHLFLGASLGLATSALATSVIIDHEPNQVIVVADTLGTLDRLGFPDAPKGDVCKLAVLGGNIVFAVVGSFNYRPRTQDDPIHSWNAYSEAERLSAANPNADINGIANIWGDNANRFFSRFYGVNRERVRGFAGPNGVLVVGVFVGKTTAGDLTVELVFVQLEEDGTSAPIKTRTGPPLHNVLALNVVTQELLDKKTDRARKIDIEWNSRAKNIPVSQRRLRWFEFLIKETGKYDEHVGGLTTAVVVSKNASSIRWLRKCAKAK